MALVQIEDRSDNAYIINTDKIVFIRVAPNHNQITMEGDIRTFLLDDENLVKVWNAALGG